MRLDLIFERLWLPSMAVCYDLSDGNNGMEKEMGRGRSIRVGIYKYTHGYRVVLGTGPRSVPVRMEIGMIVGWKRSAAIG